ncbi:uncharacterized protein LOC122668555 [Telopea speciosissima]|uniref:uncharacterized protein LOC122668555 n=1 Tax=Telopea speciosissima TaxID=54955 RepID=UPI001CC67E8E|nr:uncharacterized protein LOC122668555 [Telopea speciosissima]
MNQASLMRHIWKTSSNAESCWVGFVSSRWLRHHSIWSLPRPSTCSATWKAILDTQPVALRCSWVLLHDGHKTLLWHDPWLDGGLLSQLGLLLAPAVGRDFFAPVCSILQRLPCPATDPAMFSRWPEICASRTFTRLQEDTMVWTTTPSDRFSIQSAWNAIHSSQLEVPWHQLIWAASNHPRFSFIAWLATREALTLRTRAANWGITTERASYLCNQGDETFDHLFFRCSYTRAIWQALLKLCSYNCAPLDSWQGELGWVSAHFIGITLVDRIKKFCFCATIYRIWAEHNSCAFQNVAHHFTAVVSFVVEDTRGKFFIHDQATPDTPSSRAFLERWCISSSFTLATGTPHAWLVSH